MMKRRKSLKTLFFLSGLGLFLVLSLSEVQRVTAGQTIFSETAPTLEQKFGSPVTEERCIPESRNQPADSPDNQWCYFASESALAEGLKAYRQYRQGEVPPTRRTYSPSGLKTLFPDFPDKSLSVLFINDQAKEIIVSIDRPAQPGKIFAYSPADANRLFRYLFGYAAPIWQPYKETTDVAPAINYEVCLGDGVATRFTRYGSTAPVPKVKLFYHSACEASQYSFADIKTHWARAFIENLSARKLVHGFPDGSYRPDAVVTRADMAALISSTLATRATRPSIEFRDVAADFWGYDAIQTAYRSRFLTGYPGQLFRPNQPMLRVDAIAALAASLPNVSNNLQVLSFYRDAAAIPPYARASIANATTAGLVVNYPAPNRLNPNRPITRGEVAAVLYQTLFDKEGWINSSYIVTLSDSQHRPATTVIDRGSDMGIDYAPLANLLAAQKFRLADEQTRTILAKIERQVQGQLGDTKGSAIAELTFSNFPCADLRTIDQLWQSASGGRFGLGIQARIWQKTMGKLRAPWSTYAEKLGWMGSGTVDDYKVHSELTFSLAAPIGHLPALGVWSVNRWPQDTFGLDTGTPVDIGGFDRSISMTTHLLRRVKMCESSLSGI